jgi:hypothetical protein
LNNATAREATQALLAGPPHGLLQRQAAAVHQQQPQQRLGVAYLSGPAQAAALASDGVQIRRKNLADHLPGFLKGEGFHAR